MIELPDSPSPIAMDVDPQHAGFFQRPSSGAATRRVERKGSRYKLGFTYAPMRADKSRLFTSRLERAEGEPLQIAVPLLGVSQGIPGATVVDGAGQSGKTIAVRTATPGYVAKEGFWVNFHDAAGRPYLYRLAATTIADAAGLLSLSLAMELREPAADGSEVELGKPVVQGFVEEWSWSVDYNRMTSLQFTIEEYG